MCLLSGYFLCYINFNFYVMDIDFLIFILHSSWVFVLFLSRIYRFSIYERFHKKWCRRCFVIKYLQYLTKNVKNALLNQFFFAFQEFVIIAFRTLEQNFNIVEYVLCFFTLIKQFIRQIDCFFVVEIIFFCGLFTLDK